MFDCLVQKESRELRELLARKPLLFRKRLEEIEKTSQVVKGHWKKSDIIQTINQVPQERGWQLPTHYQINKSIKKNSFDNKIGFLL